MPHVALPAAGIILGIGLIVAAFIRYDEIGRAMGIGAGLVICNLVFLTGLEGSLAGAFMLTGGVAVQIASLYALVRDIRHRQRAHR